jgi:regulator of sirC expression with transglutaminase-like and TPR domain
LKSRFDPYVAEWVSYAKNPKFNLVEKSFKLAQLLEYPELEISDYVEKLNEVGRSLKLSIENIKNPTYKISLLNEHLFGRYGFYGDYEDYYNPKNNFLNAVIDKKSGIPITLSIIYCEVAKHIGLDLKLVGFPSHVIVKYSDDIILDPFNEGRLLSLNDLEDILEENFAGEVEFSPEFLKETEPEKILIRMIRNLKLSYVQSYAYDKAMRCTNLVLAMEPDSPEEIRDKGILEERFLNYDSALKLLNQYLELNPDAHDADFVLELIRGIRNKVNQ